MHKHTKKLKKVNVEKNDREFKKILFDENAIASVLEFYIGMKIPFTVSVSNFTTRIESDFEKLEFIKYPRGKKVFGAYQKIKNNINGMPVYINERYIKYYNTGFNFDKFYADKIYMVDIKSCYATILRNNKLITEETYRYLQNLPKEDRLSSVGLMAGRKNIFTFDETGEARKHTVETSDYSDYFFFCVQETYKIMTAIRNYLGKDFLFSWVDAVYFINENNKNKVIQWFYKEHGLESSFKELTEFEVEIRGDCYRLRYKKDEKATYMNIPLPEQQSKQKLIDYLMTYKPLKNAKRNSKITRSSYE